VTLTHKCPNNHFLIATQFWATFMGREKIKQFDANFKKVAELAYYNLFVVCPKSLGL